MILAQLFLINPVAAAWYFFNLHDRLGVRYVSCLI